MSREHTEKICYKYRAFGFMVGTFEMLAVHGVGRLKMRCCTGKGQQGTAEEPCEWPALRGLGSRETEQSAGRVSCSEDSVMSAEESDTFSSRQKGKQEKEKEHSCSHVHVFGPSFLVGSLTFAC